MSEYAVDLDAANEASRRLAGVAHRTPIATCATLDTLAGRRLYFKCEHLQKVGAFKFRGAYNALMKLSDQIAASGVVTHSSGNHGQALALAAKLRGIQAHIVMPRTVIASKRKAVEGYGSHVVTCEPSLEAREETANEVLLDTGGVLVHAYDHPDIIAGQATVALELLEQMPALDAIVAPVGGGGLVSGICIAAKSINPQIRIFAAEPAGADDTARSKLAGKRLLQTAPKTIADGLLTSLGDLTWPIIRDHVERVITVSENEIVTAMRLIWERAKLLIEPSAAVAVAAVLTDTFKTLEGIHRAAVVLSGGNVDLDQLPW